MSEENETVEAILYAADSIQKVKVVGLDVPFADIFLFTLKSALACFIIAGVPVAIIISASA